MKQRKVLVIAPSRKTRGGITAVVSAYESSQFWERNNCVWIESQIDRSSFLKLLYFIKGLFKFLFLLPSASLIHIHLSEPPSAIRKMFFFLPGWVCRKKIIVHFHSFSPDTTVRSKFKKIYSFLFRKANLVIVLSAFWQKVVEEEFGRDVNCKVLFNPAASLANNIDYLKSKEQDQLNILFAGTLNKRKGYQDLIRAFANVIQSTSSVSLTMAGNGELLEARQLAKELGLENYIYFPGWVSGKDKIKIFQKADIFCLPSYAEGFPMAVVDAVSFNIPVVTTPVGGILDVFKNDFNALIFNPGDIDGLANHLIKLVQDEELRVKLAKNALPLATEVFNLESIVEQLEQMYFMLRSGETHYNN